MREHLNLPYGGGPRQTLDLFLPDPSAGASADAALKPSDILLYFHGGGLESGDRTDNRHLLALLDDGIGVALADYSLYPDARYPDFIADAAEAAAFVLDWSSQSPEGRVFIGGSSAGAYLALMLYFDSSRLGREGLGSADFAGFIFSGGQPTVHFNVLREAGTAPQAVLVDERAPLFHVREPGEQPPALLLVADQDIPGRLEQTKLLMKTLEIFGWENRVRFCLMENSLHCAYEQEAVYLELIRNFIQGNC